MSYQEHQQIPSSGYGQQTSTLAVISLISGIASFFIVPFLGAIAAVITGNMAKKEIRQSGGRMTGESMATWGMILGWVNIAFAVIGLCLGLLAILGVFSIPVCFIPFANVLN